MSKLAKFLLISAVVLLAGFAGVSSMPAATAAFGDHATKMGMQSPDHQSDHQTDMGCVELCLSFGHLPDVAILSSLPVLAFAAAILAVTALHPPAHLRTRFSNYAAHARPSPDLVKLYAHYLD